MLSRRFQLPALGWGVYQSLCFSDRDNSTWIFGCEGVEAPTTPVVFKGQLYLGFSEPGPNFPLAWVCSRALLSKSVHTRNKTYKIKTLAHRLSIFAQTGAISSGTHLLWAPLTPFLNTHPLTFEKSYLSRLNPRKTNHSFLPGTDKPTAVSPKSVHLVTFFILNHASVICSLLALGLFF